MNISSNAGYDSDERVDLPSNCYECLDGWVVFRGFFMCALFGNLSWQYVNSINYTAFDVFGIRGGG